MAEVTKAEISACCIESVAEILRIPKERIDPRMTFSRLGLDSAMSVYLLVALEERLGVEVSSEAIYEHPSIEALSDHLTAQCAAGRKA